jgi:hypothetical protein
VPPPILGYTPLGSGILASAPGISVPTLVQLVSASNTHPGAPATPFHHNLQLPNAGTTAGNLVVVVAFCPNNVTMSVADDKSQSYTAEVSIFGASVGKIQIFAFPGTVAGARAIAVTHGDSLEFGVQAIAAEFAGAVSIGSMASNSGSSTTPNVSLTATGNDVIFHAIATASATINAPQTLTTSGTLLCSINADTLAAQIGASTATLSTSDNWVSVGVILKAGLAGAVPGGWRVLRLIHLNVPVATGAGGNGTSYPNPIVAQCPCTKGTALVVKTYGGNTGVATAMSDSQSNTWHSGVRHTRPTNLEDAANWYTLSPSTSSMMTITATYAGNTHDSTMIYEEIIGPTAFDQVAAADGSQATTADFTPFSITPGDAAQRYMSVCLAQAFNTCGGAPGALLDTNNFDGMSHDGPVAIDENNCISHVFTTGTGAQAFTYSALFPSGNAWGTWSAVGISLK